MDILVINNHRAQAKFLEKNLSEENYWVTTAYIPEQALLFVCQQSFNLILIKHDPPTLDAIPTIITLKKVTNTPIVTITNLSEINTYMNLKKAGSELVFSQPYSFKTLSKHLKLLTTNYQIKPHTSLKVYDLELSKEKRIAIKNSQKIYLRNKEFSLLEYLMTNANQVLTRSEILEHVWDHNTNIFSNTIDVHIKILRQKLDKPFKTKLIHTIPCIGYMLSQNPPR